MKTAYKWFDYLINLLLVGPLVAAIVIIVLGLNNFTFSSSTIGTQEAVVTNIFLVSVCLSLLYAVLGVMLWLISKNKKDGVNISFGKRMFWKGSLKAILSFAFYLLFSFALSFFGLSLTSTHIPTVGDPNSPDTGFPIKDLKIVNRKVDTSDQSGCDITVLNTNQSLSAANITISVDGNETVGAFGHDHIAPNKTDEGYVDGGVDTKNPCTAYIIVKDAGIAKQ